MARQNNPTFSKSTASGSFPGFYSRTMFVFNQEYGLPSDWVNTVGFNGINDLTSSAPDYCHGSHILPAYYWRDGKTIRISGTFRYSNPDGSGQDPLNMRFGIQETSSSAVTWLAIQNNNNNHTVNVGGEGIPVTFEATIACGTTASGSATQSVFICTGYYEYDRENGADVHYVPVHNKNNTAAGTVVGSAYYVNPCAIAMNFNGTNLGAAGTGLVMYYLLIEELA